MGAAPDLDVLDPATTATLVVTPLDAPSVGHVLWAADDPAPAGAERLLPLQGEPPASWVVDVVGVWLRAHREVTTLLVHGNLDEIAGRGYPLRQLMQRAARRCVVLDVHPAPAAVAVAA